VKKEHLCLIPENIGEAAAGLPVAYLTAVIALRAAGFQPGKTVLAPAIGGSVGNAVTQVARALGASHAISTTTGHVKATEAKKLGFSEVVDLSAEGLAEGVRRLTNGYGADIIVNSIGGDILSGALEVLAPGGNLTTLGYAASRKTTIDVTNLIWKGASIRSFSLFSQPASVWVEAWTIITDLLKSEQVKPIIAKTFPLESAAEALRYLVEGRPLGRVLLTI
jgi:NADPH:quinone reductase